MNAARENLTVHALLVSILVLFSDCVALAKPRLSMRASYAANAASQSGSCNVLARSIASTIAVLAPAVPGPATEETQHAR